MIHSLPILDRYIGRSVLLSTLMVMVVLLILFTFFAFMDELKSASIGRGSYDTLAAVQYVLLGIPGQAYQLFPVSALLGAMIGLGGLASNSELVVMRAAGVSLLRIMGSVMKIGLLFVLATIIIGETLAPAAERYAQTFRSVSISDKLTLRGKHGLWARDGESFINVREILPGDRLGDIHIYARDRNFRLTHILRAQSAFYRNGQWVLRQVTQSDIGESAVNSQRQGELVWDTRLSPDLLNVVTVKPSTLSVWGLLQYVRYLRDNGLDASIYEQAFWSKVAAPLVTAVMVFLAMPFVFGPLRSVGIGHRIMAGTLVGVGFHIINQMFGYVGLVFNLGPMLMAFVPVTVALIVGYLMLRRVF